MKNKSSAYLIIAKAILIMMSVTPAIRASSLANPAVITPEARISVGASYHLGGYTLTNLELPALFNRVQARCDYTPFSFLSIGLDAGAIMIDVERYVQNGDSFPVFHGKFGISGGGHLKLSTPAFLKDHLRITAIGQGSYFSSQNNNGAIYKGFDAAGIIGVQFHIPKFGFITAGPLVYIIDGINRNYTGEEHFYSNLNNIRGWIAIDFFPQLREIHTTKPYVSLEISASPLARFTQRIPVQEFSVSLSIGSITKRLYGEENDVEWEP